MAIDSSKPRLIKKVSADARIAIGFGLIGTLATVIGLFLAWRQLSEMLFAYQQRWSSSPYNQHLTDETPDGALNELPRYHLHIEHTFVSPTSNLLPNFAGGKPQRTARRRRVGSG